MTLPYMAWALAACAGATGVGLGAFGAHALKGLLGPAQVALWQTASQYHLLHAVALLALAAGISSNAQHHGAWATWCVVTMATGVVLFSGSLYGLALGAPRMLGAVTPLGGLLLMVGWVLAGVWGWQSGPGTQAP